MDPRGRKRLRDRTRAAAHKLRGLIRRVVVGRTGADGLWQLLGFQGPDDERETFEGVEVFGALGHVARPAAGSKAEAIVASVGSETGHPVIVGARDLSAQPAIEEDETADFNSQTIVLHKADGTVEARSRNGSAVALATLADLQALRDYIANELTLPVAGGTAGPLAAPAPPTPDGTSVLRGE